MANYQILYLFASYFLNAVKITGVYEIEIFHQKSTKLKH